jgi:hypothetical protein
MTTKNTAVQTGEGSAPRGITLSGQHLCDVLVLLNQLKRIANDSEVIHCGALSDINDDETIRDMINAAHFAVNSQPTTPTLRWYRVAGRYTRQFVDDGRAFEWAMSFTDGPDCLKVERHIDGAWCVWDEPKSMGWDGAWVNLCKNIRVEAD